MQDCPKISSMICAWNKLVALHDMRQDVIIRCVICYFTSIDFSIWYKISTCLAYEETSDCVIEKGKKKASRDSQEWRGRGLLASLVPLFFHLSEASSENSHRLPWSFMNTGHQSPSLSYESPIFLQGKMFGIFTNAFLWLNQQSSPFSDTFRVEKVKLAMFLLLFTWGAIGVKIFCDVCFNKKFSMMHDCHPPKTVKPWAQCLLYFWNAQQDCGTQLESLGRIFQGIVW